ncbi:hypothetical protein DFH08DRAFT_384822 [Mycena albidolilacea]|uniref:Uncharacterized protein n=1 Tax=Mycena albidolilacea TaxID=1033008 RepID=A0AAD6ZF63_9AGAR|nr:hypothetical protein DFH08DRAFT_384822 [Mycena albidolilacea]
MDTNPVEAPLLSILSSPPRPASLLGLRGGRVPPSPSRLPIFPSRSRPQDDTTIRPHTTSSPIQSTDEYLLRRPFFCGHASPPIVFQAWNDPLVMLNRVRRGSIANALPRPCANDTLAIDGPSTSSRLGQARIRFPRLWVPRTRMHTCPPCARTLVPFIRTHDDDKSMYPSRATLYHAVILGVTFPCSTRIRRYLRSNPRGSVAGHG